MAQPSIEQRFWSKVAKGEPEECWEWKGHIAIRSGKRRYGKFKICGKPVHANRVAWELTNGKIPDGLWVLHKCDNPPCCNPAHLFLGTNQDNVDDRQAKGRQAKGKGNGQAKFEDDEVREARQMRRSGLTFKAISVHFGVHPSAIVFIVQRKTYHHVE